MGLSSGFSTSVFITQVDTYTSTIAGSTVNVPSVLFKNFTLTVSATGSVTSWVVVLEGSIDGTNFTPMFTHTNIDGAGVSIFSGLISAPCLYFRTRCSNIVLGLGTSITSTVVGAP